MSRLPRPHRQRLVSRRPASARRGVTLPELLITVIMVAIIASIATPKLARSRDSYAVRAARRELVATAEAARSAAIQRGRPSYLIVRGNTVLALVDTVTGGSAAIRYPVRPATALDALYKVQLSLATPADSMIVYDARGFANPRLSRIARIRITGRLIKDSLCLTNFGQILPQGCTP
jgi:prepilin-type N-terminal cleavage/methylation domain-containing protein